MKVVNEIYAAGDGGTASPKAGCVCHSGWQSTRGPWQPFYNCNCNCIEGNTKNFNANFKKASNA